jgi:ADP-dependent NAD(P)H-hydrate dehydratase / NAD(P)H-hydrate epimerase
MKISLNDLKKLLRRKADSNKGNFGHVLIIGGDYGMGGAVIMAAEAAYRVGAGKVTILTREENVTALLARLPNAMTAASNPSLTEKILAGKNVIIIGPGLGKSKWAQDLLTIALASDLPKIIDADALNIISESKKVPNLSNSIITPHAAEAARLLKIPTNDIQKNRPLSVKKLYEKFGATSVLKGKNTLVLGKAGKLYKCLCGNSGMAWNG